MTEATKSATVAAPAYSQGKLLARQIFLDTLAAIDVRHAMLAKLRRESGALVAGGISYPLPRPPRVVSFGKAANRMATVLDEILSGHIESGVCVAPTETSKRAPDLISTLWPATPTRTREA